MRTEEYPHLLELFLETLQDSPFFPPESIVSADSLILGLLETCLQLSHDMNFFNQLADRYATFLGFYTDLDLLFSDVALGHFQTLNSPVATF